MERERSRETIREWYERTTRRRRVGLVVAAVVIISAAFALFTWLPDEWTLKLQVFNGAWTIPAFGGLWLFAFIVIWLLPMREVSFRGQETMDEMRRKFDQFLEDEARPAMKPWKELGERWRDELGPDFIRDLKEAVKGMRDLSEPQGLPPDPDRALSALRKSRQNGSGVAAPRKLEDA